MSEQTFLTLTAEQAERLSRVLANAASAARDEERKGQTDGFELRGLLLVTIDDDDSAVNVMTEGETFDVTVGGLEIERY